MSRFDADRTRGHERRVVALFAPRAASAADEGQGSPEKRSTFLRMHGAERGGEQIGRAGQELARGRRPVEATVLVREKIVAALLIPASDSS